MKTNVAILIAVLIGKTGFAVEMDPAAPSRADTSARPLRFEEVEEVVIRSSERLEGDTASVMSETLDAAPSTLSDINTFGTPDFEPSPGTDKYLR